MKQIIFEAVAESTPGAKWQAYFRKFWPAYRRWFLSRKDTIRPSLDESVKQFRHYMPELVPVYERLVDLAGGDETAAKMLSFYRPPAYLLGCSQAVVRNNGESGLIRNYDFDPDLHEGIILHSSWNGHRVIAINECLWGVADGMNEHGLALSLAYGGRKVVGDGFGIPIILRYILEVCETADQAVEVLNRIPSHMAYNVTLLDRQGDWKTVQVSPDRPTVVNRNQVATNHQGPIENIQRARFTRTLEREQLLSARLADPQITTATLADTFLHSPVYSTNYANGFGTLYTAVYRPAEGTAQFHWPGHDWTQSFEDFREGQRQVRYDTAGATVVEPDHNYDRRQPRSERRPAWTDTAWTDTAWAAGELDTIGVFRNVLASVQYGLEAAGYDEAPDLIDECRQTLEHTGRVPWERFAELWSREYSRSSCNRHRHSNCE